MSTHDAGAAQDMVVGSNMSLASVLFKNRQKLGLVGHSTKCPRCADPCLLI